VTKLKVLLAGGGTAGHTSPLIATAEALLKIDPEIKITCIGTAKGLETTVIPAAGLDLQLISPVPLPRRLTIDLLKLPWRLKQAVNQAATIIQTTNAQVIVGFGGYVSLPAYLAARRLHRRIVIHEQNALPGLANKIAARFADAVLTSLPGTPLAKAQLVGLPLRSGITELASQGRAARRQQARLKYGLPVTTPVLLVSGGSQGAQSINEATVAARDQLLAAGLSIVHVWGANKFPAGIEPIERAGAHYLPIDYVADMASAYAAADLMLARSGAATVAETASVGLPCLFVPFPHGNGEQRRNALPLIEAGGGLMISDSDLTPERLLAEVLPLLGDDKRLLSIGQVAQTVIQPGAAERVATSILALIDQTEAAK